MDIFEMINETRIRSKTELSFELNKKRISRWKLRKQKNDELSFKNRV